jgi:uncharacterized protein
MKLIYDSKYICELHIADTFIKRLTGFMFKKEPHYEAIMIKPCNSIHTFFMKFQIDVLFVNEEMVVIKKIEALKNKKIIMPIKHCATIIEATAGKFKNIKIGEKITITEIYSHT